MARKYLNLSQILKKMLFERNMRPADLAKALNMSAPTIHRIVAGKSTRPYESSLEPIANYFNITVHQLIGDAVLTQPTKTIHIIEWESLAQGIEKYEYLSTTLIVSDVSDKSFALIMPDHSMEPAFQKDAILIFDPEVPATDRSYVLVKLNASNYYVFRQLLIDADQKMIKSLNSDISINSLRLLSPNDEIIASLVETRIRNKL